MLRGRGGFDGRQRLAAGGLRQAWGGMRGAGAGRRGRAVARQTWPTIQDWTHALTDVIAATSSLPPKSLGVATCALALMAENALETELAKPNQQSVAKPHSTMKFTFESVARAACCTEDELRCWCSRLQTILVRGQDACPPKMSSLPPVPPPKFGARQSRNLSSCS